MTEHELIIRSGNVVDGSGAPGRTADVAIDHGVITEVGHVSGRGAREVDAAGALVVPGYVDIHTHYDGQATWDNELASSSWHGVTTVVAGNCGVGFAPVRPGDRDRLIELMEGVEDIPGTALHEGLNWRWESFPEYLDVLDERGRDIDLGVQIPHAALRLFVMGERGVQRLPAKAEEIASMAELAGAAIDAGALGFSTSRTINHKSSTGEPTPTLHAERAELLGIACALGRRGTGVLQLVSDFDDPDHELALLRELAAVSGRPISMAITQNPRKPELWRHLLNGLSEANALGVTMRAQVAARAIGTVMSFHTSVNPFVLASLWDELKELSSDDRIQRVRHPDVKQALIDGMNGTPGARRIGSGAYEMFEAMFVLGDPPNYEPNADQSIAAIANREGRTVADVAYDAMLADSGHGMLYVTNRNYVNGSLDAVAEMLAHPHSVVGLSDGGAHAGTICDVSFPTTLLQWWGRDRPRGRLPIELLVHKQSRATAEAVGLLDRGLLAPGHRADVNVIDFDRLGLHRPEIHYDLPAGGRRLLQRATGYVHTFVAGVEVRCNDESTGATPGRLVRGAQASPALVG